jgi:hypothetical protein
LLVLICGCANPAPPKSISQAAFFRSADYHSWSCPQLSDEANLLTDALEVTTDQQPDSETTKRIANIERAREAIRREMASKNCKI